MNKKYSFSILQYYHSQAIGEIMNIGLLIYFPNTFQIRLILPKSFDRYKSAYLNFPEKLIKTYFNYFEERVNQLNANPDALNQLSKIRSLDDFIRDKMLPPDSSMLKFSQSQTAILYTEIDLIVEHLTQLYFSASIQDLMDHSLSFKRYKKKEEWIYPDFKNKIPQLDKNEVFLPRQNELTFL